VRAGRGLVAAEPALRCQCARPCLLAEVDEVRCLKCGRPPALRLPPGADPEERTG